MKPRLIFLTLGTLAVVSAFADFSVHVKNLSLEAQSASKLEALPNGKPMPEFSLVDTTGKDITLSKLTAEKKLVLVNFWGTWCGPCRLEMPQFEKLYKAKSQDHFLILAIDEGDERPVLDKYLKEKPVSFPILLDPDGALAKKLGIRAFPTSVLVGSDGKILEVIEGLDPDWLQYEIDANLNKLEAKP